MPSRSLLLVALVMTMLITLPVAAGTVQMPVPGDAGLTPGAALGSEAAPVVHDTSQGKGAPTNADEPDYYIVQLTAEPLALYDGGISELAPTSPEVNGTAKLDPDSADSKAYLDYLERQQDDLVLRIERVLGHEVEVPYRYRFAFSGIAVWLAPEEAERVAKLRGVRYVERRQWDGIATDIGPGWIGAPTIWDGSNVPGGTGTMGEGTLAGIVDTGINMDHPSFAATDESGFTHTNPLGAGTYTGWCDPAHPSHDPALVCNDKLIGVYSYPDSGNAPEDDAGHGSHTSSTVAGNSLAAATLGPAYADPRQVSGVAPHANIIMYDACDGSCPSTATVAAIDQATADGVDVINYSIGLGQNSPWINTRMVAFYGANAAGAFVATSAGNSGPGAQTANGSAPWVTAVGATVHGRSISANGLIDMTGGDTAAPADMVGAGLTDPYGPAPIVFAQGYDNATGVPDDGQCLESFPPGTWSGEIVVCDRGTIARVQKGANVLAGGAGGFVLANTAAQGAAVVADPHFLPGVHISYANAQILHPWLASGTGHMASIQGATMSVDTSAADAMAAFSSRGATVFSKGERREGIGIPDLLDVVKPDISAPGVNVMAAVASTGLLPPPEFALYSGTSMSSPHTAGAGALIRALHPDWTASRIKSALMLTGFTANVRKEDGTTPADPFDTGSGRVDLTLAAKVGFVLDETASSYDDADPDKGGDPSSLNIASMADARCLNTCGWERTLTSVLAGAETWDVAVAPIYGATDLPAGLNLTVSPTSFTLAPGGSQTIAVDADATALPRAAWVFAQLVFTPQGGMAPEAHMPIAIRPMSAEFPDAVVIETDQTTGTEVVSGVSVIGATDLTLDTYGLVKGDRGAFMVEEDPTNATPYDAVSGTVQVDVTVPDGAKRLVAEVTESTANDVDLFVGLDANGDGLPQQNEQVCVSGTPEVIELCDIYEPPAGNYWVLAQNWEGSGAPEDEIVLYTAAVPGADDGNLTTTAPAMPADTTPFDVNVDWDIPTLQPDDRWYGVLDVGPAADRRGEYGRMLIDLIYVGVAVPTPVPSDTPVPTNTPVPTHTPLPTAVPPTVSPICVCRLVSGRVPQTIIDAAVANPGQVQGYQEPVNPGLPPSRFNPPRECLSLSNISRPYHPLFNSLIFKAGCP